MLLSLCFLNEGFSHCQWLLLIKAGVGVHLIAVTVFEKTQLKNQDGGFSISKQNHVMNVNDCLEMAC